MQRVVILEDDEWARVQRVLEQARRMNRKAARGEYRDDFQGTVVFDLISLQETVCVLDGLCADPRCDRCALHPSAEHELTGSVAE